MISERQRMRWSPVKGISFLNRVKANAKQIISKDIHLHLLVNDTKSGPIQYFGLGH